MNQKFTKKELERLGCTEEELKLVTEYQKKLPIIVENDNIEKFCVDARTLHTQLCVGKQFSHWIQTRIKSYNFVENVDFKPFSPNGLKPQGGRPSIEYLISIDMAKQLSMIERTKIGNLSRRYYILMEDLVNRNKEWWETRKPQRENYLPMCNAISESIRRVRGRKGDDNDFKYNANIINIIATGSKAQSIKNYLGIGINELTRDSLLNDYNEKIAFLQEQNILLLGMDLPIIKRVNMLINFFDIKYPDAKPLQEYRTRDDMLKARKDLLKELES
jgi:phage anti-repressor protein